MADKPECCRCALLEMQEVDLFPEHWVEGRCYRCTKGRFSQGITVQRWFAWSGIVRPNKTVAAAQKDCPFFKKPVGLRR